MLDTAGSLKMGDTQVITVDIGGSHIASAIFEADKLLPDSYTHTRIDSGAEAAIILEKWVSNVQQTLSKTSFSPGYLSIAMPGPFDYERGISLIKGMNKYEALYGLNIKQLFSEQLNIPAQKIFFYNDALSFILGEAITQPDNQRIIGITLGTGLGSARCFGLIAEDVNRGSSPFLNGIAEDYLSTRWFVKRYHQLTGKTIADVKSLCNLPGEKEVADQLFAEFADHLGRFLDEFIGDELPDAVVIGGNIAKAADRFMPSVKQKLAKKYPKVTVKQTELWDSAALIGAGYAAGIETNH